MAPTEDTHAGHTHLQQKYSIHIPQYHVQSFVGRRGGRVTVERNGIRYEYYQRSYWPGDRDIDHLAFALKFEGLHLALFRQLARHLDAAELEDYIRNKPTGANARRIWYLYESLTGAMLALPDLTKGNYVFLLDVKEYYTVSDSCVRSSRHRVWNNLLGSIEFSPFVRRTATLGSKRHGELRSRCQSMLDHVAPELFQRTINYLYTKETRSTYEIEHERADAKRMERFINTLKAADVHEHLDKDALVELQNQIVEPRFIDKGYRSESGEQVYVGKTMNLAGEQELHFVPPKPQDIELLMSNYVETSRRMRRSLILDPIVTAAVVSYVFVFLHPFTDGNGRIHRFLIHNVLATAGVAPQGAIFPVSAAMLRNMRLYDQSLEAFSKLMMPYVEYTWGAQKRLTVNNDTQDLYRYIDCTGMAEALYTFIENTIEQDLPAEISFLQSYDKAWNAVRDIVDLPNRHVDLFIRLSQQNGGRLSKNKRHLPEFELLTDEEITALEDAVIEAFKGSIPEP